MNNLWAALSTRRVSSLGGFTLIELLIVVSIISILAAIAVPNFLEAQQRSKVSRVKADMHSLTTAIEAYHVDHNKYPYRRNTQANPPATTIAVPEVDKRQEQMKVLTTPVAYITSLFPDVFETILAPPNNLIDYFDPTQCSWLINSRHAMRPEYQVSPDQAGWLLVSVGPDKYLGPAKNVGGWPKPANYEVDFYVRGTIFFPYDPTNGTISYGNIYAGQVGGVENAGNELYKRTHVEN